MQQSLSVNVVPFKFKHLPLLLEMLNSRSYMGIATVNMKTLPKIGYIALLEGQPIAAGFLRRVEGGFAQLDGLTSNPYFGSIIRHEGIEKVVNSLIAEAKSLQLHGIIAFSSDKGVLSRSEGLGFQTVEQTIIALPL